MHIIPSCRPGSPPVRGVYAITHTPTGRRYVGSTVDAQLRLYDHLRRLTHGTHRNCTLQADWLTDGPDAFTLTLLEPIAEPARLLEAERHWLAVTPMLYNRRQPARNHHPSAAAHVRFWRKVRKTASCWLWTGSRTKKGYGTFNVGSRTYTYAHRYAYVLAYGAIPHGRLIHHCCHTRLCVNPAHLVVATPKENTADIIARGISFVPQPRQGERVPGAKLSADKVRAIRARYDAGETKAALGRAFGVDPSQIAHIVTGQQWRHIL